MLLIKIEILMLHGRSKVEKEYYLFFTLWWLPVEHFCNLPTIVKKGTFMAALMHYCNLPTIVKKSTFMARYERK
jgi:hypothetical protein